MDERPKVGTQRGLRLEEFDEFVLGIAQHVWNQDERLKNQNEQLQLTHIEWLYRNFPDVVSKTFADRHLDLWRWAADLTPGIAPLAKLAPWPRGGGKSSTAELICAWVGVKLSRRFVLYVSATQEQADAHVQTIAGLLEEIGFDRAVGKYGTAKGWRRNQLRAANGFNVVALGLDAATRGIKLGKFRPDLIILDDVDSHDDTPKTVLKKESTIASAILAAGSADVAVLFVQNLIHEGSIINRIMTGRSDLLLERENCYAIPAVEGLEVELEDRGDGAKRYRIVHGSATWDGQDLRTCEQQINRWGLRVFRKEAQHEVKSIEGLFFNVEVIETVDQLPEGVKLRFCRAWDLAGTQDGGNWTVGALLAIAPNGVIYVVDVKRHQFESSKVRELIEQTARRDAKGEVWEADEYEGGKLVRKGRYLFSFAELIDGKVIVRGPQDPGQAGKDQAQQLETSFAEFGFTCHPVSGSKATRATTLAEWTNKGNLKLLRAAWNFDLKEEWRLFREDETHEEDDIVDASADAVNELTIGLDEQVFEIW